MMRVGLGAFTLGLLLLAVGCGGDDGQSGGTITTGGTMSGGGGSGGMLSLGSGGSTGGAGFTSGGDASSGGSGNAPNLSCPTGTAHLSHSDGTDTPGFDFYWYHSGMEVERMGADSFVLFNSLDLDTGGAVDGFLVRGNSVECIVKGSTATRVDNHYDLDLKLTPLGTCPSADTGKGSLTMCSGFSCGATPSISGTVAGTTATTKGGGGSSTDFLYHLTDNEFFVNVTMDASTATTGPLTGGVVVGIPGGSLVGAAYCVGGSSTFDYTNMDARIATIADLGKLGDCDFNAAPTASASGCMPYQ